jgi:preprotein translocase subunit SecY
MHDQPISRTMGPMFWWGAGLVVLGAVVAGRAIWTARRPESTGAHGLLIAVGVALVFWGVVLGIVALARS